MNTPNDGKPDDAAAPLNDDAEAPPEPEPLPDPAKDYQALAAKWEKQARNTTASLDALKRKMQGLLTPEQVKDQQEEAAEAKRTAAEKSTEALRLRVALTKGVPPNLADRLIGATQEELEADADEMLALLAPAAPPPPPSRIPDAGAGTGKGSSPKHDANELLRIAAGVQF